MTRVRIVDVTDEESFTLVPPCADPAFDHRTCDYWEDAVAGSKAHREGWLRVQAAGSSSPASAIPHDRAQSPVLNPFLEDAARRRPAVNPFAPETNPFAPTAGARSGPEADLAAEVDLPAEPDLLAEPDLFAPIADNPFAPPPRRVERPGAGAPRKLGLLGRGLGVFGSYARVLLLDDRPAAYCQFGPLSAYPRALRLRDLYPQLPASPLPAVITCIATTEEGRRRGHALALVDDVCRELSRRGFAAVETYPEAGARVDATSAAFPGFWERAGFEMVVADDRFPVMRREL